MRVSAVILAGLLVSGSAVAQTVPVRSGWQAQFTRLVLTVPEGIGWQLGRSGADYLLVLEDRALIYDLDGVFDRIPGTRLAGLDGAAGTLRITLACDCHATAFLWRPDRLVIDLVDGPPPEGSPHETAVDPPGDEADETTAAAGSRAAAIALPPPAESDPFGYDALMPDPFRIRTEESERLSAAEEALIRSIARAASQGLLTTAADAAVTPPLPDSPRPAQPDPSAETPAPHEERQPGIAARTAIDRDLGEADPFSATDDRTDAACLPQSFFAFDTWGDATPFHAQLSEARRSLVGEFDRLAADSAADLARTYLYFGFGTEALGALALIDAPSEEHAVLAELSRLVDDLPGTTGLFAEQIGCRTPAALWALLGRAAIPARPEVDRNGVLQYFKTLPAPVQGQVAGRLAPLFLDAGDEDAAAILLDRAARSPATDPEDVMLAVADLAMHYGDPESSLQEMIDTARNDGRTGPEMLLRIFELSAETGTLVPRDLLDLASVLRFEHRGQPVVADLAAAEIRTHLLAGDHDRALATIEDERKRLPADRLEGLLSETLVAMAQDLDDVGFLERVLPDTPRPLTAEAENAVARRLIDLGLVSQAAQVMLTAPVRAAAQERRYLRAEIALALGEFARVDDLLAAMTDARATDLRAAALSAGGDYTEAYAVGAEAMSAADAAWRAGAWSRLAVSPDPELSRLSVLVIDRAEPDPVEPTPGAGPAAEAFEEPPTIAGGRALLAESAEARELLDTIIARFPAPADDPRQ
ncbi:hypothetical protein [Histidinibacterium lentulum]|uniref:HEAT repeat domain-containing protein n=1 Tax=Histidinibacterium lentulum TaxID=2480588 RepID=A0A3N2R6Y2_9RHOB|nr:hypothetical protein [Histidinibacterium lentulum]ROU03240.1 hypothetical protein EAT49_08100 [Histidinibacterium lentulum]